MSPHMLRRWVAALATPLLLLGLTQLPSTAAAVPQVSSLRVVSQDWNTRGLNIAFTTVSGATRYQAKWSTSSSMSSPRYLDIPTTLSGSTRSARVPNLVVNTKTYLQVRVFRGTSVGAWSRTTTGTVKALTPSKARPTATGVEGGVRFDWAYTSNTTQNRVQWSPTYYATSWPGAPWPTPYTNSLTAPRTATVEGTDAQLTRTPYANPIYGWVETYNYWKSGYNTVRSANGTWAFPQATAPDPEGAKFRVGTWNVACVTCRDGRVQWPQAVGPIARQIVDHDIDVMLIQEASGPASSGIAYQDLLDKLDAADPEGEWALTDADRWGNPEGDRIFYSSSKFSLQGIGKIPGLRDRNLNRSLNVPWAKLQDRATGAQFIATSLHFSPDYSQSLSTRHNQSGQDANTVIRFFDDNNPGDVPVIVGGDLATGRYPGRTDGAQATFVRNGDFYDAMAAQDKFGFAYNTYNGWNRQSPDITGLSSRSDYLLMRHMAGSAFYKNVAQTGTVLSDHNLVLAEVSVPQ